jgi:hypothetical protein
VQIAAVLRMVPVTGPTIRSARRPPTFITRHPVLRHEALHFIIWRALKLYGHAEEFFMPCDKAYPE